MVKQIQTDKINGKVEYLTYPILKLKQWTDLRNELEKPQTNNNINKLNDFSNLTLDVPPRNLNQNINMNQEPNFISNVGSESGDGEKDFMKRMREMENEKLQILKMMQ